MTNNKIIRSTAYQFLLYPDNESHLKVLELIKSCYQYCYILHNRDVTEDGELKKDHIHCIVKLSKQKTLTALCNEVGLEKRFCQKINSFNLAVRYLIHKDNPEKYQYQPQDIVSNLNSFVLSKFLNSDMTVEEKAMKIIDNMDNANTYRDLVIMCCKDHCYDELRRMGILGINMFKEIKYGTIKGEKEL